MLTFFRRIINSRAGVVITFITLGVIALAFAAGDVSNLRTNGMGGLGGNTVAKAGDQSISAADLRQAAQAQVQALIAAERLRDAGLDVILHASPEGRNGSFKSQFKRADASGARFALILGVDELARGEASIKWLRETADGGRQQTVPLARVAEAMIDAVTDTASD